MDNPTRIFTREIRKDHGIITKLSCALLALALSLASGLAHEPGDGPRFKANSAAKIAATAPQPAASAVTDGLWTTLAYEMPINPIHIALMQTGKVLVVAGSENTLSEHQAGQYYAAVWDTQAGTFAVQNLLWDVFCNGMAHLPDGRILVVGGSSALAPPYGDSRATVFDPATSKFTQVESMAHGRWYASVLELNDGGLMTFSGITEENYSAPADDTGRGPHNKDVEIYGIGTGWSPEYEATWTPPLYPRMHLLTDGTVFYSGETTSSNIFDPTTKTWTLSVAKTVYTGQRPGGSSVLLPLRPSDAYRARVMILGGDHPATATTEVIDFSATKPAWRMLAPMSLPRVRMNAVLLPTGKVLALGGSSIDEDPNTASLATDLFDPVTETWTSAGVAVYPRLYHSGGLLLPDATVAVVGSNPAKGTYEKNIEIYSPAYLFTVDQNGNVIPATRPTITSVPAELGYGSPFTISTPDAANISSAVLVKLGSPTHSFDFDQRVVGLSYTTATGALNATAPPNSSIAPPGYYMVFVINQAGVPSLAKFLHLSPYPNDLPPKGSISSPATDVSISPGQSVNFAGSATDPDGTVTSYSWVFPDGTPASSSVPTPGLVTFSDVGTYVCSLTARDEFGVNDPSPPTRTVTVQMSTLQLLFTAPAPGSTVRGKTVKVSLSANGTTSPNTFTLSVDGTQIGTKSGTLSTVSFTWTTTGYAKGLHTLSATVKDGTGNTGSASETVTLQ
ncbi:MAG TPA: galactose oxidase-like domain-containing protein [Chthoniobacterales bacterium]